jgi:hypothetical protein
MSTIRGTIKKFTFNSDCLSAEQQIKASGVACVDGTLMDNYGQTIKTFTFNSDCLTYKNQLYGRR